MPRLTTSGGDPLDFCRHCFPTESRARWLYSEIANARDDNRFAWDVEHPPYEGTGYRCEACGNLLTDRDNGEDT